jgi:hypothetical protein
MEYTGLTRDTIEGRLFRAHYHLRQKLEIVDTELAEQLAGLLPRDAERDRHLAQQVAGAIRADPTVGKRHKTWSRWPKLPLPLALLLALAIAGMLIGLMLRMLPPPKPPVIPESSAPQAPAHPPTNTEPPGDRDR